DNWTKTGLPCEGNHFIERDRRLCLNTDTLQQLRLDVRAKYAQLFRPFRTLVPVATGQAYWTNVGTQRLENLGQAGHLTPTLPVVANIDHPIRSFFAIGRPQLSGLNR